MQIFKSKLFKSNFSTIFLIKEEATKFLLFLFLATSLGCAGASIREIEEEISQIPKMRVFRTPFDDVWRASQLALAKYPIRVNDMDAGVIETDSIRGKRIWLPPYKRNMIKSGLQYKITLKLLKGESGGDNAVRVSVNKTIEKKSNFFADVKKVRSDGLEEIVILYRIQRELGIESTIQRLSNTDSGE